MSVSLKLKTSIKTIRVQKLSTKQKKIRKEIPKKHQTALSNYVHWIGTGVTHVCLHFSEKMATFTRHDRNSYTKLGSGDI